MFSEQYRNHENFPESSSNKDQGQLNEDSYIIKRPGRAKRTVGIGLGLGLAMVGGVESAAYFDTKSAQATETHKTQQDSNPNAKFIKKISETGLPTHLTREEIDPRYAQLDFLKSKIIPAVEDPKQKERLEKDSQEKLERQLAASQGWADSKRQRQINELLDNREVKKVLSAHPDFSLADVISLLKATVLNEGLGKSPDATLEKLIEYREAYSKREIIGIHTDQFIGFNYAAADNEGEFSEEMFTKLAYAAMGEGVEKKSDRVKIISTGQAGEKDPNNANAGEKLLKAIEQAPHNDAGHNTVILFNTHGTENYLEIDGSDRKHPQVLEVKALAMSLLNRLYNDYKVHHDSEELSRIDIIIDSCNGYGFRKNLISLMETYYKSLGYEGEMKIPFSKIGKPYIVAMSGEKSPLFSFKDFPSGIRALTTEKNLEQIQQGRGVYGQTLFDLQSQSYVSGGDPAFFVPVEGKLLEISSQEPKVQKSFKYGDQDLQVSV